ncbi:MAG TPA: hypothetical protein DCE44_01895, partial [Verrucomicrobiales bacterium]|nr:hypothetical protein [Verrucomicrobiales bacterium]
MLVLAFGGFNRRNVLGEIHSAGMILDGVGQLARSASIITGRPRRFRMGMGEVMPELLEVNEPAVGVRAAAAIQDKPQQHLLRTQQAGRFFGDEWRSERTLRSSCAGVRII